MTKQNFRSQQTNTKIQKAFFRLLKDKEFKDITVGEIASTAKVGRSTFYSHYLDKYDLLEKIVQSFSNDFQKLIDQRFSDDLFLYFDQTMSSLLDQLNQERNHLLLLLNIHTEFADLHREYQAILRNSFHNFIEKQGLTNQLNVPVNYLTTLYSNVAMTFIIWQLENGKDGSIINFGQLLQQRILNSPIC